MSEQAQIPAPVEQLKLPARTSAQKAAALLALLDDNTLRQLQGRVPERHRDKLLESVKALSSVTVAEQRKLVEEFAERLKRERNALRGDDEVARRLKSTLFQEFEFPQLEVADDLAQLAGGMQEETVWDLAGRRSVAELIRFFEARPASVFAIALRQFPEDLASEIASGLSIEKARDAVVHVATTRKLNPLATEAVESLLREELLAAKDDDDDAPAGDGANPNAGRVAGILNRLTSSRRDTVLEALRGELEDGDLGDIEDKVLKFEALEDRMPRNAIPILFRELDQKTMLTAVKFGLDRNMPVAEYLLKNISQRLAGQYREQMDAMPAIDEDEGEKAQSKMICFVLQMADEGRINLLDPE
jgi:flagellar motor switch protein FliG